MFFKFIGAILWIVFFIWALADIIKANKSGGWKILWIIICLAFPVVGTLVYYFVGRPDST